MPNRWRWDDDVTPFFFCKIGRVIYYVLWYSLVMGSCAAYGADKDSFSFKKLMMPGALSHFHAEYENECGSCHSELKQVSEVSLCLDCHEEVNEDVDSGRGYHGRIANVKRGECRECHSEHLGRKGNISLWDKDGFDHSLTDFKLTGKHLDTFCASCHQPDKKYREAPSQCVDCHKEHDAHQGAFGDSCQDCHSAQSWKTTQFDHGATEFPLKGLHKDVQCNACHPDQSYKNTPKTCASCHQINDVHNGVNGSQCQQCHRESGWNKPSFDHNKDTRFKLIGGHDNLTCSTCHQVSGFDKKIKRQCISCHQSDDEHDGNNGQQCAGCHSVTRWSKTTFNHNRDTDFALSGKHQGVSCESCHLGGTKKANLASTCISCHQQNDVHQGQQGEQCQHCHQAEGWQQDVQFNHDFAPFPLLGMHAVTHCESCHESKRFKDTAGQCVACHKEDDIHRETLGNQCDQCHNPNAWQLWLFDHSRQTDFLLEGAHESLSCESCHRQTVAEKVMQSAACVTCHVGDDVHNRQFGRDCSRCHSAESFKKIKVR